MVYWAVTTVLAECLAFTFAFVFWVNWNWSKEMIIKVHRPTHVGVLSFVICLELVSLHIRSMWETICDAWSCWSGWNFGPNSSRIPLFWSSFRIPPPPWKWKLSESPNPRVSEYPHPENKNCQRVQIREFQNTPPPHTKGKLSESPNLRVSEYPPPKMENCQRVKIGEFQNPPPISEKLQISNFRILLKIREIYVETNL